ncbi:MAG: tetratricopeptide repeat protein [Polyangiaceae bacterium]|nr:tetratricopeptide repeat protein [Polyangiaceae bacterium]
MTAPPPWAGPYDAAQQEVLKMPLDTPVQQPAGRVYPDLARFTFIGESPIQVPADPLAYANLVTEALKLSPLLYVFRTGPASLANPQALYGPKPQVSPDPWTRVELDAAGRATLVPALPGEDIRALLDRAAKAEGLEALALLREAAAKSDRCPGVHAMLADSALGLRDFDTAQSAARQALEIDPTFPHAHRVLAETSLQRGDEVQARASLARALAAYPTYPRAWKVAEALLRGPVQRNVRIDPPFIEVNPQGAVIVVTCGRPFCEGYGACKAALRYEPHLRATILKTPPAAPYHLSATEEVVCLEAGVGAHLAALQEAEIARTADPVAERLAHLASTRGLSAYAMFEIIGRYRPEWLRVAPEPVHDAVVDHVLTLVLGAVVGPAAAPAESGEPVTAERRCLGGGIHATQG